TSTATSEIEAFLAKWPDGEHAADARARLRELRGGNFTRRGLNVHVPWGWIGATAASVLAIGWGGAHPLAVRVGWLVAGDAKPALGPSKDDLATAAKSAGLKAQAAAAERRRHDEAEAKRKAGQPTQDEAERQRLAALQAQQERQRKDEEAR